MKSKLPIFFFALSCNTNNNTYKTGTIGQETIITDSKYNNPYSTILK